jgi:hypothetical protein
MSSAWDMSKMNYGGVVRLPLYIAPWKIPARLVTDMGFCAFDAASVEPVLMAGSIAPTGSPYFNLVNPGPFDFGHFFYDPTGIGEPSGPHIHSFCGDLYNGYQVNSFTNSSKQIDEGVQYTVTAHGFWVPGPSGGSQGQIYTSNSGLETVMGYNVVQLPYESGTAFRGTVPLFGPSNRNGMFVAHNAQSCFWVDVAGASITISNYNDDGDYTQWGNPIFSNESIIYFGQNSTGQAFSPFGYIGTNPPINLTFEGGPDFSDCFDRLQNGHLLLGLSDVQMFSGMDFTPVIMDPSRDVYYAVQLVPYSSEANQALKTENLSFVSAKLSIDGNMYLTNFNQPDSIFHTVSLSLPPFSVNIETPVPIVLPCFNPCQNLILG